MRQIGVDIVQLPEADGFKYVVVAVDYLSKFCDAKPLASKSASEVARFLFEWICLFGCPTIVINDQGREFVNEVSGHLYLLTGVHQRITSAYNPQANGQVERQNQIIKCGLLKVLKEKVHEWPTILEGVLFAHRVQKQRSTGFSPYFLLFGQEPVLPIDVKLNRPTEESSDEEIDADPAFSDINIDRFLEKYDDEQDRASEHIELIKCVEKYICMKKDVMGKARENIKAAQNEQKLEYDKRNNAVPLFKAGQKVLLRNLRRDDRKGGWSSLPWSGPYTIIEVQDNGSCRLRNLLTGVALKQVHRQANLKVYHPRPGKFTKDNGSTGKGKKKSKRKISSAESNPDDPEAMGSNGPPGKAKSKPRGNSKKITSRKRKNVIRSSSDSGPNGCPSPPHTKLALSKTDHKLSRAKTSKPAQAKTARPAHDETTNPEPALDLIIISSDDEVDVGKPLLLEPRFVETQEIEEFEKLPESTVVLDTQLYKVSVAELCILNSDRWINDQIINAYLIILSQLEKKFDIKVHHFNTFFWSPLNVSIVKVSRWTKGRGNFVNFLCGTDGFFIIGENPAGYPKLSIDIFEASLVLVPLHLKNHWALCVIDNKLKEIIYYDSSPLASSDAYMEKILMYLKFEHETKKKGQLPAYKLKHAQGIPSQANNYDCGVFLCYFARQVCKGEKCSHNGWAVSRLRHQLAAELLASRLLPDVFEEDEVYFNWPPFLSREVLFEPSAECTEVMAGAGLKNLGNTCDINACIQVLFHVAPIATFLERDEQHRQECSLKKCLTCVLGETFVLSKSHSVVEPTALLDAIKHFWKDFVAGRMEDAAEFLSLLLQQLSKEYLGRCFFEVQPDEHTRETTPIGQIFGFYERTTTTCCQCNFKFKSINRAYNITFTVKDVKSVKKGLDAATSPELVQEYKCYGCRQSVDAFKIIQMETLPLVLTIYQKRFSLDGKKVTKLLSTPNHIDLKMYLAENAMQEGASTLYEFVGEITHLGESVSAGHYTSGMKCFNGFFRFDDEKVLPTTKENLLSERSYVLFYQLLKR